MKKIATAPIYKEPKALVLNRINMVNKLGSKDYYAEDTNALIKINDKWWARPSRDYQGLRLYLLLTCFDVIGRYPANWGNIFSQVTEKLDLDPNTFVTRKSDVFPMDYTIVYQSINDVYALKNSFYYFINTIIGPKRRRDLLDSIVIKKIGKYSSEILDYEASDNEKLKFLFDIRHCYSGYGNKLGCDENLLELHAVDDMHIENDNYYHFSVQWNPTLIVKIIEEVISRSNSAEKYTS